MMRRSFFFLMLLAGGGLAAGQGNPGDGYTRAPEISAHRGASRQAPENTLAAFSRAIESGADFIELDVRTTSDGRQVCLHDASLKRTTGFDLMVKDISFKKVKSFSAGIRFGAPYAGEKIPSLEEVCDLVAGKNKAKIKNVNLYVDCKDIRVPQVIRILRQHELLSSSVFYGDVNTLLAIRKMAPSARLLPAYPGPGKVQQMIRLLQPFAFDVDWADVNSSLVLECHQHGIKVFCDLLDENDRTPAYLKAIELGIDLIQTDDVVAVKKCIIESEKATPQ